GHPLPPGPDRSGARDRGRLDLPRRSRGLAAAVPDRPRRRPRGDWAPLHSLRDPLARLPRRGGVRSAGRCRPPPHRRPGPRRTGRYASGEWALYPLADQVTADGTAPDHMRDIHAAIENARERGTFRGSEHFVTRLEGDVGEVIATAVAGWLLVGRSVQHVTSHLTLSLNSPSHEERELEAGR